MKAQRQRRIVQLLRHQKVSSQEELARLLRKNGEQVTQATLSRDLEELGATKVRDNGRVVYRMPEEPPSNDERLRRIMQEFALDVEPSGNLVLVKTPPASAGAVARAIDTAGMREIAGTIAGDDTVLVVCREGVAGSRVARKLRTLAGQFTDIKEANS